MAVVKKLDSKRRAVFPDNFRSGDILSERVSGNEVTFRLLEPAEVPEAEFIEVDGVEFIKSVASDSVIAAAVRAERDSR